jgi:hypothetical protein
MTDNYIEGNTSQKITVTNSNPYNISIKAWMIQPTIKEWMRSNRTLIDDISWISIEPSNRVIPPNSSSRFYIYIDIPDNETKKENRDEQWEIWAALKIDAASGGSPFEQGYNIRVYVDTPVSPSEKKSNSGGYEEIVYDTLIAVIIVLAVFLIYYKFRNRI